MAIVPYNRRSYALSRYRSYAPYARAAYTVARRLFNNYGRRMVRRRAAPAPRRTYKRRRPTRRRKTKRRKTSTRKKIRNLERKVNADIATHTNRIETPSAVKLAAENTSQFAIVGSMYSKTDVEALLSTLRYYDPNTPSTLVTADGSTGSYNRSFYFASLWSSLYIANNYEVPVDVTIYCITPKSDTNGDPVTTFQNGISDQAAATITATDTLIYPTDIDDFKHLFKIKACKKVRLIAGQSYTMFNRFKAFNYDPSLADEHTDAAQSRFRSHWYCLRVQGVLGHEISSTPRAYCRGGVDTVMKAKTVIKYDAGVKLNDFTTNSNMQPTVSLPSATSGLDTVKLQYTV